MAQAQQLEDISRRAPYAGLYLSVPLGGNAEKPFAEKARFGFAAGYQQPLYGRAIDLTGRKHMEMKVVNLQFNQRGFDQFSVAGLPFAQKNLDGHIVFLAANEEEKKGGMGVIPKILLIGAGIAVGSFVLMAGSFCASGLFDGDDVDTCVL